MRRRKWTVLSTPFIMIYLNIAERQRLLLMMGPHVLLYRGNCALKQNILPRWIRTGDEVIIDANNDLFIVDRLKVVSSSPALFITLRESRCLCAGNFEGPRLSGRPC